MCFVLDSTVNQAFMHFQKHPWPFMFLPVLCWRQSAALTRWRSPWSQTFQLLSLSQIFLENLLNTLILISPTLGYIRFCLWISCDTNKTRYGKFVYMSSTNSCHIFISTRFSSPKKSIDKDVLDPVLELSVFLNLLVIRIVVLHHASHVPMQRQYTITIILQGSRIRQ